MPLHGLTEDRSRGDSCVPAGCAASCVQSEPCGLVAGLSSNGKGVSGLACGYPLWDATCVIAMVCGSAAESQRLHNPHVFSRVFPAEVAKQASAPADHLQKTSPGRKVLPVGLEVLSEFRNPVRQSRYLNLRGTDVVCVNSVRLGDLFLCLGPEWHTRFRPPSFSDFAWPD